MTRQAHGPAAIVSFGLRADTLDPARVTEMLGMSPSNAHRKGELSLRKQISWGLLGGSGSCDPALSI
jgi:hypothetical protein